MKDNRDVLERNGIYNITDLFWRLAEFGKPELEKLLSLMNRSLPRFERINSDANGVKILDRTLGDDVEVYIKPTGIICGYDKTDICEHVQYALSFPEVRELIKKHRKDGWKLPDV